MWSRCLCAVVHVLFVTLAAGRFYSCGDGYCHCENDYATCSGHYGNLTYVPQLPEAIRELVFQENSVKVIEDADFFHNVSNITSLSLAVNNLTDISLAALRPLKHLGSLDLSVNANLTFKAVAPIFLVNSLRYLRVAYAKLTGAFPDIRVPAFPEPQLERLELDNNRISHFNMTVLRPFTNLTYLDVSNNDIYRGLVTDHFPRLDYFDLTENTLQDFPDTCKDGLSLFPSLLFLVLEDNLLTTLPKQVCLPKLERLWLGTNRFMEFESGMFSQHKFPMLRELDLSSIPHSSSITIHKNAFRNPSLESLSLQNNDLLLSSHFAVDPDSFAGCDSLRYLGLSDNSWNVMTDPQFQRLFGDLTKLETLDLEHCDVDRISSHTFQNLKSLNVLSLSNNRLRYLPDRAFGGLSNLTQLYLDRNEITMVGPDTFGSDNRKSLQNLDISENPFMCSCDLMWFHDWLTANPSLFVDSWGYYYCENFPDTTVQSFHMPDQACLLSREASVSIIVTISLLISTMTLALLLYSYRWHIRLVLYEAFRGRGERLRRLQEGNFLYDVFVSYDSKDLDWVRAHLIQELEERMGLKLCLHERDFIAGNPIVDNISDCVEASKKVLMLFSTNFAQSHWCQFELNFCLRHVMDFDDALVVVMLHDIPARDLTTAMMAVMKTTTYIEWDDTPDARASFWGRLRVAFREIMPGA